MVDALSTLGATFEWAGQDLRVCPGQLRGGHIEVGLAGTVLRFLTAVAALGPEPVTFDGDEAMYRRPITPLLDALRSVGVRVDSDALPYTVTGPMNASRATVDSSASSQFLSALLLVGPRVPGGLEITHRGRHLPSLPHIDMTLQALRSAGVRIDTDESANTWRVHPGPITPGVVRVEPDLSNAAPFLAAALVTGGRVTIPSWPASTTQVGARFVDIAEAMGGSVERSDSSVTVCGPAKLDGIEIDMGSAGELVPTVAAVAALAATPSRLTNIGHIRGHETDRLAAIATELRKAGGSVTELEDELVIEPSELRPTLFHSYADHRMATFGAIIGLTVPGCQVDDIECTSKTMPEFRALWEAM